MKGATSTEYNLEVEMIFIIGGRLVIGWHDRDFEGQFTLSLTGDPDNEYYVNEDWETGIPVPSNSLGRLTLNAPIATKVVCFSCLLKCLRSLYGKQCGPRSDCSYRSSLFWVHAVCFYT